MSNYYDDERDRERGRQWDDDDWQPESGRDTWQSERMRRRMTPGQTSYGGPARQRSDEAGAYRRWSDERYGRQDPDERYGAYGAPRYPDAPRRGRYGGSDPASYQARASERGGNRGDQVGRYGRYGRYGSYGSYGSDLREGMNGGYGWERAREWRDPRAWQRDDQYAEREWRQSSERARASDRGAGSRDTYFSDLRSDTRYWTDPDERPEDQRYGRHYSREAAQRRGWEVDHDRDDDEHGTLYNLGRRIGEAVGDWFGTSERHERPTGPRGYQRTDERIRDHICERLSYARRLDVSDVSVDVKDGVVTLSGTVNSRSQKYYIEELVDDTYGVSEVNNDIRVRRDAGSPSQPGSGEVTGSTWRG